MATAKKKTAKKKTAKKKTAKKKTAKKKTANKKTAKKKTAKKKTAKKKTAKKKTAKKKTSARSRPAVALAVVVRPEGRPYDLLGLTVGGAAVVAPAQALRSDTVKAVDAGLVSPAMRVRCDVQPSQPGVSIAVKLLAWSSAGEDDPSTTTDERWVRLGAKTASERFTIRKTFNAQKPQ